MFERILGVFCLMSVQLFAQNIKMNPALFPQLRDHLIHLSEENLKNHSVSNQEKTELIAQAIKKIRQPGKTLSVLVVCTGNSRRSMMGSAMGNAVAAYLGISDVRFFSGGTVPSAFNSRAIRALEQIGFVIHSTDRRAVKGPKGEDNPIYSVAWGEGKDLKIDEFSKLYSDALNPQDNFIALMVCDEANKQCPIVKGASAIFAIPFEDPKSFDGTPEESARYAERRDDLGRFMLKVLGSLDSSEVSELK